MPDYIYLIMPNPWPGVWICCWPNCDKRIWNEIAWRQWSVEYHNMIAGYIHCLEHGVPRDKT
jgi:hypothetical protein